jgi:hypothetical protein
MVDTVCAARRTGRRGTAIASTVALAIGLVTASAATFTVLGAAGSLLPAPRTVLTVVAALCLLAALGDGLGLRVRPQIRLQVPERWRRTLPLPLASFLYGVLLGTGFSSAVPAFASWGLLFSVVALGHASQAFVVGLALGVGRAALILTGASVAERPLSLRAVRLAGACALALAALDTPALAAGGIVGSATDPSAAAGDLAWEQPGVGGFLRRADGTQQQLPGHDPAIGGALIAWHEGSTVTVADRTTLQPRFVEQIVGVRQLAISDAWLVLRQRQPDGTWRLIAQSVTDTSNHRVIAEAPPPTVIGRPAIDSSVLVYATSSGRESSITSVDLSSASTRRLRSSHSSLLLNPSLLNGQLLYDEVSRCAQWVLLGPLAGPRGRVLYTLSALAGQDAGHDRGRRKQGARTPCKGTLRPTTSMLWTTALAGDSVYVTTLAEPRADAAQVSIVEIRR